MQTKSIAKENIVPEIICTAAWRVAKVIVLENYKLEVYFMDGAHGLVDIFDRVMSEKAGVFELLRDVNIFNQAYVLQGVVTWPGEIDIAPDTMYEAIVRAGKLELN